MTKKTDKEEILKKLVAHFDEQALAIYDDSKEQILIAGCVGFNDAQMFITGAMNHRRSASLMLVMVKGLSEMLKIINDKEAEFLDELIERLRESSKSLN